jgi:DNA-directed RNA polymerase specialized sigma24 family protein
MQRIAVQEAFLAAFLGLKALRDAGRFRAWIFGIVANVCRYRLRRRREGYFHDEQGGQMVTGFTLEDARPSAEAVFETRSYVGSPPMLSMSFPMICGRR